MFPSSTTLVDEGMIGEVKTVWVRPFVPSGSDWYFHDWHATRRQVTMRRSNGWKDYADRLYKVKTPTRHTRRRRSDHCRRIPRLDP